MGRASLGARNGGQDAERGPCKTGLGAVGGNRAGSVYGKNHSEEWMALKSLEIERGA